MNTFPKQDFKKESGKQEKTIQKGNNMKLREHH